MVQSDHMQIKAMEMQGESGWEATVRNRKDLPPTISSDRRDVGDTTATAGGAASSGKNQRV